MVPKSYSLFNTMIPASFSGTSGKIRHPRWMGEACVSLAHGYEE